MFLSLGLSCFPFLCSSPYLWSVLTYKLGGSCHSIKMLLIIALPAMCPLSSTPCLGQTHFVSIDMFQSRVLMSSSRCDFLVLDNFKHHLQDRELWGPKSLYTALLSNSSWELSLVPSELLLHPQRRNPSSLVRKAKEAVGLVKLLELFYRERPSDGSVAS